MILSSSRDGMRPSSWPWTRRSTSSGQGLPGDRINTHIGSRKPLSQCCMMGVILVIALTCRHVPNQAIVIALAEEIGKEEVPLPVR